MPGAVVAALSLITITGVWFATTPEPGRPEPDGHITVRRTARWCVMVQVVSAPLQMFAAGAGVFAISPLFVAGTILWIIALTGQAAELVYLRRLALRIPAPKLARFTKLVTWGYLSCQVAAVASVMVLVPVMATAGGPMTTGTLVAMGVFGCGVGLGTLVFGVWALVLLFRYRAVFRHAAEHSRASWGPGAGSPQL